MNSIRESFYRKVDEKRFSLDEEQPPPGRAPDPDLIYDRRSVIGRPTSQADRWDREAKQDAAIEQQRVAQLTPNDIEYDRQKQSAKASAKDTASAFGPSAAPAAGPYVPNVGAPRSGLDALHGWIPPNVRTGPPPSSVSTADTGGAAPAAQQQAPTSGVEALRRSVTPRPPPSSVSTADTGGNATEYDRQKQSALASAKDTASAFGPSAAPAAQQKAPASSVKSRPAPSAPAPTAAATLPLPRDSNAVVASNIDVAAKTASLPSVKPRPAPSPVSTADTGGDKYGSGNASAGFERGKYAAPDASDNSSGANELRSKQQAADQHTANLGESKSKYMSESTMIRNLLRNR